MASQKYPTDPIPIWIYRKATSKLKVEYEAALCRRILAEGLSAHAAGKVNWHPREMLGYLRQEHRRWWDVSNDMMVNSLKAINSLNGHWN